MNAPAETKPGLWTSLQRLLDTALATAQTRIELFATELGEERGRLVEAILCAAALVAGGLFTLTLVTLTVVLLFWERGRLPALITLSVLHLAGTGLAWRALRTRLRSRTAFAETIGELKKDRACLAPKP